MAIDDTIVAISSPTPLPGQIGRTILRISGAGAFSVLNLPVLIVADARQGLLPKRELIFLEIRLPQGVCAEATAYCFPSPASYTGQDLLELHILAAVPVVDVLYQILLGAGIRQAGPGEFTQRAYLNGKLDLSQAEAVMHIISASNDGQLEAAQRLLDGGLRSQILSLRQEMLELLSLLEAGLDFAEEDIEFISSAQASKRICLVSEQIRRVLDGAVRCEELMELPSVGLAGLPNAGKSSLMNALTHRPRSIVSDLQGTTRDILTDILELDCGGCVLFDCAGLGKKVTEPLDELAMQSAQEALNSATVVLFCLDLTDENLDMARGVLAGLQGKTILGIATKADQLSPEQIDIKLKTIAAWWPSDWIVVSSLTGFGIETLKTKLADAILSAKSGQEEIHSRITINLRHRQKLDSALKRLAEAADEVNRNHPEIAAMLLRQSMQDIGGLEHEYLDERILDVIFSKFCIGK